MTDDLARWRNLVDEPPREAGLLVLWADLPEGGEVVFGHVVCVQIEGAPVLRLVVPALGIQHAVECLCGCVLEPHGVQIFWRPLPDQGAPPPGARYAARAEMRSPWPVKPSRELH